MNLELYYFIECPFCQRVLRKIDELGIQSIVLKNTMENPEFAQKLLEDTGRRTVPCLYINGKPMHESDDINAWLVQNKEEIS